MPHETKVCRGENMKTQEYNNVRVDLPLIETDLRGFFSRENFGSNFSVEVINENADQKQRSGFTLKARWTWLKLSYVFRVRVALNKAKVIVQVGEERQGFKVGVAAAGGIGLIAGGILVAPVAITGGIAAYRAHKINEGIWDLIDNYMAEASRETVEDD
jgi:hypothetical protein